MVELRFILRCVNYFLYLRKEALFGIGMIDFIGAGTVHVLGGVVGLIGSIVLGYPHHDSSLHRAPHMPVLVLGSLVAWLGWYSFIPGTALLLNNSHAVDTGRVAIVTTLSCAASGIASFILHYQRTRNWEHKMCIGILGGLVATSGGSFVMDPWAGIVNGLVAAIILSSGQFVKKWCQVFDPLEVVTLHGAVGAWGILSVGLFAQPDYVSQIFSVNKMTIDPASYTGILYGGNGLQLAVQFFGLIAIVAWTTLQILPFFLVMDLSNILRATKDEQDNDPVLEGKAWLLADCEQHFEV